MNLTRDGLIHESRRKNNLLYQDRIKGARFLLVSSIPKRYAKALDERLDALDITASVYVKSLIHYDLEENKDV